MIALACLSLLSLVVLKPMLYPREHPAPEPMDSFVPLSTFDTKGFS